MTDEAAIASLVDAHCHVDLYRDPQAIIDASESSRIYTLAVTNAPSVFRHTQQLVAGKKFVRAAVGLHPELARTHAHEVDQLASLLKVTRFVGEIGLDNTERDKEVRQTQRRVFDMILRQCATYGDKVLTVHSRRASRDVLDAIGTDYPGSVILHWFSGPLRDISVAAARGFYFSVNPAMIRSSNGQRIIASIPQDRLLTETDGPFTTIHERACEPGDVQEVVDFIAHQWDTDVLEMRAKVEDNFRRVFGISS